LQIPALAGFFYNLLMPEDMLKEEIKVDQPTFQFIIVKIDTDYLLTLNNYVGLFQEIFPEKSINEIIEEIEK